MTREQLIAWMRKHGYTIEMLATELGVDRTTVGSWLRPPTSKASRRIPQIVENFLALLEKTK